MEEFLTILPKIFIAACKAAAIGSFQWFFCISVGYIVGGSFTIGFKWLTS